MKVTKVLGIVLGTLLVAALFTGAAAADNSDKYLGDAYAWAVYQDLGNVTIAGNTAWTDGFGNTVTFLPEIGGGYYISGDDVVAEGDYSRAIGDFKYHITVKMPTNAISGAVYDKNNNTLIGALIGSTVMNDKFIQIDPVLGANIAYTNPDGTLTTINPAGVDLYVNREGNLKGADLGTWTVQAYYDKNTSLIDGQRISQFAPDFILGKEYYFTIVSSDTSKKLETTVEEIVEGNYATVTLTAPTGPWVVSVENGMIPAGQPLVDPVQPAVDKWTINVPAAGVASFSVKAESTSDVKVKLLDENEKTVKSLTIKVTSGKITVEAKDASVIIGNEFDIEGTNELGGSLYFLIKGTNFPLSVVKDEDGNLVANGKVWDATVKTVLLEKTDGGKRVDAGSYTIYAVSLAGATTIEQVLGVNGNDYLDDSTYVRAYSTVSVALKQPFITITQAPEVLVQGEKLVVKGTAEGDPKDVQFYIFGTNYFNFGTASVTDGEYSVELPKTQTKKELMAAGQYFLVIQHPMYDDNFNIGAYYGGKVIAGAVANDIVLNKKADVYNNETTTNTVLFSVDKRQSANAAQALCDNLDNQDIDDMYAKASFIVAGPTSYIDAIPTTVTKGQVLTVSGTTTGHKDDVVTVELLSTAFAAIPKEAVGSASFVALTTKIGDDGVWSITFDTSNLNADEYTCSVAVADLDATTSKVTIVEGSTPVTPTQTTPVTPTAKPTAQPTATPATPGFGALAALAGLGAVAVLLLRRQ